MSPILSVGATSGSRYHCRNDNESATSIDELNLKYPTTDEDSFTNIATAVLSSVTYAMCNYCVENAV